MNVREHQSFRLAHLIQETVETYQMRAAAHGTELQIVNDFVSDILLMTDLRKLKSLFGLILRNAIDHSGASSITFSAKQMLYFENHVLLEFCFTDNGNLGKRSFTYYRALVQIRQMVEELHGKSEMLIVAGVSSYFKFIIKSRWRHTDEMFSHLNSLSTSPRLEGRRILVADANEINQLLIRQILHMEGAEVDTACDGIEAIRMVEHRQYDLILLDLKMPHMDGFQTANYINKRLRKLIPLVALSVSDSLEVKIECQETGISCLLKKPFSFERLIGCLVSHFSVERSVILRKNLYDLSLLRNVSQCSIPASAVETSCSLFNDTVSA